MRISKGACDELRTANEIAEDIIALARRGKSTPANELVCDVHTRLMCMGLGQLRNLHAQILAGQSQIIFPQIVRDLGLNFEVHERRAA